MNRKVEEMATKVAKALAGHESSCDSSDPHTEHLWVRVLPVTDDIASVWYCEGSTR